MSCVGIPWFWQSLYKAQRVEETLHYYSSIMLAAFASLLCSKLCRHNVDNPSWLPALIENPQLFCLLCFLVIYAWISHVKQFYVNKTDLHTCTALVTNSWHPYWQILLQRLICLLDLPLIFPLVYTPPFQWKKKREKLLCFRYWKVILFP